MDYKSQTFDNVKVELDGNYFSGCRFRNCELIFRGKDQFTLEDCDFERPAFIFLDSAGMVIDYLKILQGLLGNQYIETLFQLRKQKHRGKRKKGIVQNTNVEVGPYTEDSHAFDISDSTGIAIKYIAMSGRGKLVKARNVNQLTAENILITSGETLSENQAIAIGQFLRTFQDESDLKIADAELEKLVKQEIDKLAREMKTDVPRVSVIKECVKTLRNVTEGVAGGLLTPIVTQQIQDIFQVFGVS